MNRLMEAGDTIKSFPQKFDKYYQVYLTVVGVPIFAGGIVQFIFLWLFHLSPWASIVAVILAFFLLAGSYKLVYGMLRKYRQIDDVSVRREVDFLILGYFGTVGVLAVIALSTLSFLLFHFHVLQYVDATKQNVSSIENFETFTRLYWWCLIDNLPGVETDAFNWHQNITPNNFLSKVFVFVFQLFIAYAFLVAIKQWWDNRKQSYTDSKS